MPLDSLYSGFTRRAEADRQETRAKQARQEEREWSILNTLAHSPDPQTRDTALIGLMQFNDPRAKRKGLAGFLGETEGHPAMGLLAALAKTPVFDSGEVQGGVPGGAGGAPGAGGAGQIPTPPPAMGAAAGSGTSPVTGGQMTMPAPAQAPPTPTGPPRFTGDALPELPGEGNPWTPPPQEATAAPAATGPAGPPSLPVTSGITPPPGYTPPRPPSMQPRQMLMTPEEQQLRTSKAKAQGDVEGEVAGLIATGMSEQEARELVKQKYARSARGAAADTFAEGEIIPDASSPTGYTQILYNRTDPSKQQRIPAMPKTGAAGSTYAEGEIVPDTTSPTGFSQTLYLRSDPTKQQKIPAASKTATSSRSANAVEQVAFSEYGSQFPGATPRTIVERLTPQQMQDVIQKVDQRATDLRFDTTAAAGAARAETPGEIFRMESELGKEWRTVSEQAKKQAQNLYTMEVGLQASKANNRAFGDQAVLVTFQKSLDDLSVVREAEYFRSGAGLAFRQRIQGAIERFGQGGASIPIAELEGALTIARQVEAAHRANALTERDRIASRAKAAKLDVYHVLGQDAPQTGTQGPPPAPSTGTGGTQAAPPAGATAAPGAPPGAAPAAAPAQPPRSAADVPTAWKVGDATPAGKILAIHPVTGNIWLDIDGPVPASWKKK